MSTQQDTNAAAAGLAGLLSSMVNRPVTEEIGKAVADARFRVDKQIKESEKGVKGDLAKIIEEFPKLLDELESVRDHLDLEIRKRSAELEEKIAPRFGVIGAKQEELACAFHTVLDEAFTDVRVRDERLDERIGELRVGFAAAMNEHASAQERQTAQLSAHVDQLTVRCEAIHGGLESLVDVFQKALGKAQDEVRADNARLETRIGEVKTSAVAMNERAGARMSDLAAVVVERVRVVEASVAERANTLERQTAQLLVHVEQLDAQGRSMHGTLGSDVAALGRNHDEHRKAMQDALADLTTAISVIGQGQKNLTKLVYGALGMSTVTAVLLVIYVLRVWPR